MRLADADAYSAEMKERQEAAWKWRNEAIAEEDELKLARAEGAFTAFTEAKLTMDKHIISPWHRVEDVLPRGQELVIVAVKDTAGDTPFWYTQCGFITTDGEYWIVDNEICDYVVAWMPLPEPPKEDA